MKYLKTIRQFFRRSPRTLTSLDAYSQWAETYQANSHNVLMKIEEEAMLALLPSLEGRLVLDLACGTGRYGLIAKLKGAGQVIGFDNSMAMLKAAEIDTIGLSTTEAIPLATTSVDVIICGLALGHLEKIEASLSEISRILKLDGIALISDFHPYQYLSGARRTFQASDGKIYNVEHHVHHVSDYHRIARENGLSMTGILEPTYNQKPVVLVMRFEKLSS